MKLETITNRIIEFPYLTYYRIADAGRGTTANIEASKLPSLIPCGAATLNACFRYQTAHEKRREVK